MFMHLNIIMFIGLGELLDQFGCHRQVPSTHHHFLQFALVMLAVGHDDQMYDVDEHVPLFVDNLVPFNNPQESYRYYTLKFCKPDPLHHKSQTLGEVLQVCIVKSDPTSARRVSTLIRHWSLFLFCGIQTDRPKSISAYSINQRAP